MAKRVIDAVAAVEQAHVHLAAAPGHDHLARSPICRDRGKDSREDTVSQLGHDHGRARGGFGSDVASFSFWIAAGPVR